MPINSKRRRIIVHSLWSVNQLLTQVVNSIFCIFTVELFIKIWSSKDWISELTTGRNFTKWNLERDKMMVISVLYYAEDHWQFCALEVILSSSSIERPPASPYIFANVIITPVRDIMNSGTEIWPQISSWARDPGQLSSRRNLALITWTAINPERSPYIMWSKRVDRWKTPD